MAVSMITGISARSFMSRISRRVSKPFLGVIRMSRRIKSGFTRSRYRRARTPEFTVITS